MSKIRSLSCSQNQHIRSPRSARPQKTERNLATLSGTEMSPAAARIFGKWGRDSSDVHNRQKKGQEWPRTPASGIPEALADNRGRPPNRPPPACASQHRHMCLSVSAVCGSLCLSLPLPNGLSLSVSVSATLCLSFVSSNLPGVGCQAFHAT